jgi:hypothetical protein
MLRSAHTPIALLVGFVIAVCGLSACGGPGDEGKVIATVGKSEITQAALNHWMAAMVGGDYRQILSKTSPVGLVSDPPDYSRCVTAAKQIVPSFGERSKLSDEQFRLRCRQLYAAVKEQALSFLISVLWRIEEEGERGVSVSEAELTRVLNRIRYEQFPNPAQFKKYLAEQHRSLSDERYLLKRNILNEKFLNRLKARAGSGAAGERALGKLALANNAKWISRTVCEPGYIVPECRHHEAHKGASPSAAVVLEQLRAGGG